MRRPCPSTSAISGLTILLVGATVLGAPPTLAQPTWGGFARNPQHTGVSGTFAQSFSQIVWQTPVDVNPDPSDRGIHYGSPIVTESNKILVPVKYGVVDSFRIEARDAADGTLLWQYDSDYRLPPISASTWIPPYGPVLTPSGRLYLPAAGGTLLYTDTPNGPGLPTFTRVAFYGIANYNANPAAFNADIQICTPLTSDSQGNLTFAFRATGANPLGLAQGIARMGAGGTGTSVTASAASGGLALQMPLNCAPALSNDEQTLYVAIRLSSSNSGAYLVSLDATTLATLHKILLKDPADNGNARVSNQASASPMVAPDGRVYLGVLETLFGANAARGWLLQFNADLTASGPPGAFGSDITPSIVSLGMVPSYSGAAPYLIMTKYNNYAGTPGGDGINKLAILDPNDSQLDVGHTGIPVMKEVLTQTGVTPDPAQFPTFPNAVKEWCINTAAVDPVTSSVLANSEDGKLYRWYLPTNTLSEVVTLTGGVGEAYTPTLIDRGGRAYAINDKVLFAVGLPSPSAVGDPSTEPALELSRARPNPFTGVTSMRISLSQADQVSFDILDAQGRRVASLLDGRLPAGEHAVQWDGRGADGRRSAAGLYFARLVVGTRMATRRIVYLR